MAGNNTAKPDQGVKDILRIMKLIGYTVVFIAGVILNILLLLAVTRKRLRHRNTSKTFIIIMQNLAVADILLLISTIPFDTAWHETGEFPYGAGMCTFLWPFQTACFQAVVFTYVILSFHRTYGVKSKLFGQMKSIYGYIVVVIVWIASISTVIPYMVFLKHTSGKVDSCDEDWEKVEHRQTYTVFLFLLQYLIPMIIMLVLYLITWMELKNYGYGQDTTIRQRTDRHKRVNLMLIVYLVVFAVLLLPHQIMWFMLDFGNGANDPHFFDVLGFLYVFTYLITVTNVVMFFRLNSEFQSDLWFFLRCYSCRDSTQYTVEDNSQSFSVEDDAALRSASQGFHHIGMEPYKPPDAKEAKYNPTASMEL